MHCSLWNKIGLFCQDLFALSSNLIENELSRKQTVVLLVFTDAKTTVNVAERKIYGSLPFKRRLHLNVDHFVFLAKALHDATTDGTRAHFIRLLERRGIKHLFHDAFPLNGAGHLLC